MLDHFSINGFRCFDSFKIDGMKRINLIVGKNSTGKTALLEALQIYMQSHFDSVSDVLDWRDGVGNNWTLDLVKPLFYHQEGAIEPVAEFVLKSSRSVRIGIEWGSSSEDKPPQSGFSRPSLRHPDVEPSIVFKHEGPLWARPPEPYSLSLSGEIPIGREPQMVRRRAMTVMKTAQFVGELPVVFLHSDAVDSEWLAELFDEVAGLPIQSRVDEVVRWIIPASKGIITKTKGGGGLWVKYRESVYPLRRFGDGVTRLVALACCFANARGGVLLIDEIETGLHWKLFDPLWPAIARFAEEFDVQVLATTHSKDCQDGFARAFEDPEFDACLYRLENRGESILPVRVDRDFFSRAKEREFELR